ncbi:MAG TPA: MarR family winged helix-turn-helix transcriptional regulator [Negativicutes bacterium]
MGKWISILYRSGQAYFDKCFDSYKIGDKHYRYLLFLYRQEGITQDAMSKYFYVDKATTARAILALEEQGYIYRKVDPIDKRAYKVFLTEQGRSMEPIIRSVLNDWVEILTGTLTEEERKMAYNLLQRMADNVVAMK